jgi:histidine triad (HIT) family protein
MALDNEQIKTIKAQLLKQINSYPEDKRESVKEYIESMNNEELEEFLIKNNLIKSESGETKSQGKGSECIYCLLSSKSMPSLAIYEDKDYLAVLEIKPLSEGHIVLIPKKHIKETKSLKSKAFSLADRVGKHIVKKLGAENFQISSSDELKHAVINIIPTYKSKELNYKRPQADSKKLQELAIKIGEIKKADKKPGQKKKPDLKSKQAEVAKKVLLSLPRRIP